MKMLIIYNRKAKQLALKNRLLTEYSIIAGNCEFGSFQCIVFDKAVKHLNAGVNPYEVQEWVIQLEKQWLKL